MRRTDGWIGRMLVIGLASASIGLGVAAAQEPVQVTIVGTTWYGHAPAWVGIEKGFFKEAGFDATYKFLFSTVDRVNTVASGDAKFGSVGLLGMLSVMAQGNKAFYWVGNQDQSAGTEGIVAQAHVKDLKDLKGRKLALQFGGSEELVDYFLLKQVGLDMYKDLTLVNIRQPEMVQAFTQKFIDAAGAWSPEYDRLQKLEGAHVIATMEDLFFWKKYGSTPAPDVLLINKKFADEDVARGKRFMKAYFRAVDFVRDNPDETAEIAAKYTKQDVAVVKEGMKRYQWRSQADQKRVLSEDGLFGLLAFVVDFLHDVVKKIDSKPNFREWVRADIVVE